MSEVSQCSLSGEEYRFSLIGVEWGYDRGKYHVVSMWCIGRWLSLWLVYSFDVDGIYYWWETVIL